MSASSYREESPHVKVAISRCARPLDRDSPVRSLIIKTDAPDAISDATDGIASATAPIASATGAIANAPSKADSPETAEELK